MFYDAAAFNQPLNNWDTSSVTNMSDMFSYATAFNQTLNNWNTSNVTNMGGMFKCATAFNQPLNNWDTSNVTTMYEMFFGIYDNGNMDYGEHLNSQNGNQYIIMGTWEDDNTSVQICKQSTAFNQPLNNWDTSNVINMSHMFSGTNFNQPLNTWNTSNVKYMSNMFYRSSFNQPLSNWSVSGVTNMYKMFYRSSFNQSLSNWYIRNAYVKDIFKYSGLSISNFCALFKGVYGSYWKEKAFFTDNHGQRYDHNLGISYSSCK
jgi:surface protein